MDLANDVRIDIPPEVIGKGMGKVSVRERTRFEKVPIHRRSFFMFTGTGTRF